MIQEKVKTYEALAGSRNLCNNICLSFCLKSLWFLLNLRSYLGCSTNRLLFLFNICLPYSSIKPTLSLYLLFFAIYSPLAEISPLLISLLLLMLTYDLSRDFPWQGGMQNMTSALEPSLPGIVTTRSQAPLRVGCLECFYWRLSSVFTQSWLNELGCT